MSPDSYNAEVLKTLKSIDERVSRMEGMLMALCAGRSVSGGNGTTGGAKASPGGNQRGGGGEVASERDLDSQYGDPTVKKDPKRWTGESFAGCRMSECPPEYLEVLADLKDWMADKDEEKGTDDGRRFAKYGRLDAARARGWAERKRNGWTPLGHMPTAGGGGASGSVTGDDFGYDVGTPSDDDIQFVRAEERWWRP